MHEIEVRNIIIQNLKALDEINSCTITIRPYGIYIQKINQTNLTIYDLIDTDEDLIFDSLLLEANLKIEQVYKLTKLISHLFEQYSKFIHKRPEYNKVFSTQYKKEESI